MCLLWTDFAKNTSSKILFEQMSGQIIDRKIHSLTPFFRNLNKGNGRKWRIDEYRDETRSLKLFKNRL